MSIATSTAKKCFDENVRLFANAQSQPEKYNLYTGLQQLAQAVEALELALETITQNQQLLQADLRLLRKG